MPLILGLCVAGTVSIAGIILGLRLLFARLRKERESGDEEHQVAPRTTTSDQGNDKKLQMTALPSPFPIHRPSSPAMSDFSAPDISVDPLTEAMVKVNPNAHTWFNSQKMETLRGMVVKEQENNAEVVSSQGRKSAQRLDLLFIGVYPQDSVIEQQQSNGEQEEEDLDVSSNFS